VIGLTGTNGKTTTKELICSVLKQKYNVTATAGNMNNHIGVPVTLLAADSLTEILIVEMGANHPGEIAFLCNLAKPDHGLITNIGKAHLEGFGSYEGVIQTKNELFEWIKKSNGKLFINEDDELLKQLAAGYPAMTYGTNYCADVYGVDAYRERYLSVLWQAGGSNNNTIHSQLTGTYNLYNILAAISIGISFGLDAGQIKSGIESYVPDNMRSQWIGTKDNVLFLDAYNANPSSMKAAIENFAKMEGDDKVLLLGAMMELGGESIAEHIAIVDLIDQYHWRAVVLVGGDFKHISHRYLYFQQALEVKEWLQLQAYLGVKLLVKGSRSMQMEKVLE
jgi:UDP-N-acetylmuramoyl-tripeptide--D-alanyl-D-alanine ligase